MRKEMNRSINENRIKIIKIIVRIKNQIGFWKKIKKD